MPFHLTPPHSCGPSRRISQARLDGDDNSRPGIRRLLLRGAVASWAGLLVCTQLLGLALSDPARLPFEPERVRAALAVRPDAGVVVRLRIADSELKRTFSAELPEEWWKRKGQGAAPEAFFVFVDGEGATVVGAGPIPEASSFATRRERGDSLLWISCSAASVCREAWIVRRELWWSLLWQMREGWLRAAVLAPFSFFGLLAAASVWFLAPMWPPLPRALILGTAVVLTTVSLVWFQQGSTAASPLLAAEALLGLVPPGIHAARSLLRKGSFDVLLGGGLTGAICVAWVGALFTAYHPGILSPDSLEMYLTGLTGHYRHNVYPLFVSFLYGLAGRAFGSPGAILLAQLLGLALAMAFITEPWVLPQRKQRWLVLLGFLAAPPVWWIGVVLWSDVALATALLWCVVAIRKRSFGLSLVLLVVTSALRHNAILGTAPLMALCVHGLMNHSRWIQRLAAWCLAVLAGAAGPVVLTHAAGVEDVWPVSPALVWDIVSISRSDPEVFEGSVLRFELQVEQLHQTFNPATANTLFNSGVGPPGKRLTLPRLRDLKREIVGEWWSAVRKHPMVYLEGRLSLFSNLLDLPGSWPGNGFYSQDNPPGYEQQSHALFERLEGIAKRATGGDRSLVFRGWLWGLILVGQVIVGFRRSLLDSASPWIALSGLCYLAGFLPVGQGRDFRFLYWPIVACFAAAAPYAQASRSHRDPAAAASEGGGQEMVV